MIRLVGVVLLAVLAASGRADDIVQSNTLPLDVRVPHEPSWVAARDHQHALYELHIANYGAHALTLERIEVRDGPSGVLRQSQADAALQDRLLRPGLKVGGADKTRLDAGQSAVVFLDVIAPADAEPPRSLAHRLIVRLPSETETAATAPSYALDLRPIPVGTEVVVLGAPLRGDRWLAANGLSNTSDHRRTLMTLQGRAVIAQRYAIDFIQLGANGRVTKSEGVGNEGYFGYGADLLAVANGTVVAVKDDIPENTPMSGTMATRITVDTVAGNYVLLDINGAHVLYAHAIPGSIRVKEGAKVRRGDVLARLGNSGNSDAPHLHLHVVSEPTALASEGVAYVFDQFSTLGRIDDLDAFIANDEQFHPAPASHSRSRRALPLSGDVVDFGSSRQSEQ